MNRNKQSLKRMLFNGTRQCNIKKFYKSIFLNDALNTFYLWLYGLRHMDKDHSDSEKGNPLYHIGYSLRLTARVILYAPSHRQDSTYHGLCYTSHGALAGTRNSSMGSPHEGSIRRLTTHCTMSERSYHSQVKHKTNERYTATETNK